MVNHALTREIDVVFTTQQQHVSDVKHIEQGSRTSAYRSLQSLWLKAVEMTYGRLRTRRSTVTRTEALADRP